MEDFTEHNNHFYSGKNDKTNNREKYKTYNEIIFETNNEKKEKYNFYNELVGEKTKYENWNEKIVITKNEKKEKTNNEKIFRTDNEEKYKICNEKIVKSNNEKREKFNNEKIVKSNNEKKEKINHKKIYLNYFKGFKGPISCIIQSSESEILVTCYDGNVYLFSEPKVKSLHSINYNLLF